MKLEPERTMPESFTAIEYAVLVHLKAEGRCTIPAIAADLLLRPSEVETAITDLVKRSVVQREGDFYSPGAICVETPSPQMKRSGTAKIQRPIAAPAMAPAAPAEVANVFKQARERSNRERHA